MRKICILLVLHLALFFYDIITGCEVICSSGQYINKTTGCCKVCPACGPGEEYTNHCGHDHTGKPTGPRCKPCQKGFFQEENSYRRCSTCQSCSSDYKVEVAACTPKSDTVCADKCPVGKHEVKGVCHAIPSTTVPLKTIVTTPTTAATTKQVSSQKTKTSLTSTPPTPTSLPGTEYERDPQASRNGSSERRFGKPGWMVFFSLMGFLVGTALVFVTFRKRKQIKELCIVPCRKYRELLSDHDVEGGSSSAPLTSEDHYTEQAHNVTNGAEPFFPRDEAVSPALLSPFPFTKSRHPGVGQKKEIDEMQCTCRVNAPAQLVHGSEEERLSSKKDTISNSSTLLSLSDQLMDEMGHSSSSEELQACLHGRNTPSGKSSSNPPTPGVSSREGATPVRGVSPENRCSTACSSSSPSPCFSSRNWSRNPSYTSSSSINETSSHSGCLSPDRYPPLPPTTSISPRMTPRGQSPSHSCNCLISSTPSPCGTPQRGPSSNQSPIPSTEVHSESLEEPEISNQSSDNIPMSIEACDEKHETLSTPRSINSSPVRQSKESKGNAGGWKKGRSQKKDLVCSCKQDMDHKSPTSAGIDHSKGVASREKDPRLIATTEKSANPTTTATIGKGQEDEIGRNSINTNSTGECKYKKICRKHESEHRCRDCCPLPNDSIFSLINNDRPCLREEICRELNKNSDYKNLAICGRVEAEVKELYECSPNPAERVLDQLKALRPQLKLKEFQEMLTNIKRNDIAHIIEHHHLSCNLCMKNSFDSRS